MFMGHFLRFRCWEQKLQVWKSSGTANSTIHPRGMVMFNPVRASVSGDGDGAAARGLLSFATAGRRGLTSSYYRSRCHRQHRSYGALPSELLKALPSELRSFIIKATVLTSNLLSFVATRYRLTSCWQLRSYWARVGG